MQEVIEKWKINKGLLASKMGMLTGTFCNKLSPKHPTQFTQAEAVHLKMILKEMAADLDGAAGVEFNEALSAIVT